MLTPTAKPKSTRLHRSDYDDLTAIRGIGQTRQQWLRETFDVYTFADLAALAAEAIETQFKAEKKLIARSEIDGWLREAQQRASTANPGHAPLSPNEDWTTLATFVIVFEEQTSEDGSVVRRTNIHHMEADETQTWPQIEQPGLLKWMMTRLSASEEAQNDETTEPALPIEAVFSPKLEQLIAKAQALTQKTVPITTAATDKIKPSPAAKVQTSASQETPGINQHLQQMIAKVRSLEERKQR